MADYSLERIEIAKATVHADRVLTASVSEFRGLTENMLRLSLSLWEPSTVPGAQRTCYGPAGWHGGVVMERVPQSSPSVMRRAVMQARVILDEAVLQLVLRSSELYGWEKGSATNNARAAADRIMLAMDADMVKRFPDLFTADVRVPGGAA